MRQPIALGLQLPWCFTVSLRFLDFLPDPISCLSLLRSGGLQLPACREARLSELPLYGKTTFPRKPRDGDGQDLGPTCKR